MIQIVKNVTILWLCPTHPNKKFELMLPKSVKAYSSFCSQTVSLSPVISPQFTLGLCFAAKDRKNQ